MKRSWTPRARRRALVGAAGALALTVASSFAAVSSFAAGGGDVSRGGPVVQASGGPVWPGLPAPVRGSGFRAGPVTLTVDGVRVRQLTASTSGAFRGKVTMPLTAKPGRHLLTATQGKRSASVPLAARVQWAQAGMFADHRGDNFFEHKFTARNADTTNQLFASEQYNSPEDGFVLAQGVLVYATDLGVQGINATSGQLLYENDQVGESNGIVYNTANGLVYLNQRDDQELVEIDPLTGNVAGQIDPGMVLNPGMTINDGILYGAGYVGGAGAGGQSEALDLATGQVLWKTSVPQTLSGNPALYDGTLYITGPTTVNTFDAATGTPGWSVPTSSTDPNLYTQTLTADADGVVVPTYDGGVRSFSLATGTLQWATGDLSPQADNGTSVTLAGGVAYVSYGEQVVALDETTGTVQWIKRGGGGPTLYANGLLFGPMEPPDATGEVMSAVDTTSGTAGTIVATWPVNQAGGGTPVVADGVLYLPDHGISAYTLPQGSVTSATCRIGA